MVFTKYIQKRNFCVDLLTKTCTMHLKIRLTFIPASSSLGFYAMLLSRALLMFPMSASFALIYLPLRSSKYVINILGGMVNFVSLIATSYLFGKS